MRKNKHKNITSLLSHYDNWNEKSKVQQRYKVATKKSSEWMNKDSRQCVGFTFKGLVHLALKDNPS